MLRAGLLYFCALLNLVLAILLYSRMTRNKAVIHLSLTALFSALYSFATAMMLTVWSLDFSYSFKLFWARATWVGILALAAYVNFVYYFTNRTKNITFKLLFWYVSAGTLFLITLFTPLVVTSLKIDALEPLEEKTGMLGSVGRVYIIAGLTTGLIYLLKDYLKSKGFRRLQLRYFILGTAIYSGAVLILTGIVPLLLKEIWPTNFAPLFSFFWIGLTGYAITRYRLMDIRFAIHKGIIYLFSCLTIGALILFLTFIFPQFGATMSIVSFFGGILSSVLFLRLAKFYEKIAGRYFYYTAYNIQNVIAELQEKLTRVLEIERLSSLIINTLKITLQLDKIAIITRKLGGNEYIIQDIINFDKESLSDLIKETSFLRHLEKEDKPLLREELAKKDLSEIREKIEKADVSLYFPLILKGELIGIIILGDKITGEAFSSRDISLLTSLARSASIAFENALLYSEIKKRKEDLERFNKLAVGREMKMIELKEKIKELEEKLKEKESQVKNSNNL